MYVLGGGGGGAATAKWGRHHGGMPPLLVPHLFCLKDNIMARDVFFALLASLYILQAMTQQVLILGGGAAGIAAAYRLQQAGVTDFLILEAGSEIGGRLKTASIGGKTVEQGANWVQGTTPSWLYSLVVQYGIAGNLSDFDDVLTYDGAGEVNEASSESGWEPTYRWGDLETATAALDALSLSYQVCCVQCRAEGAPWAHGTRSPPGGTKSL